jgi:hypothetical protein
MWTSSTIYTFHLPSEAVATVEISDLIESTPELEAPSSSSTSKEEPAVMARHDSHSPHGSPSTTCSQLSAFAKILAVEVFPVPLGPLNKKAWETVP